MQFVIAWLSVRSERVNKLVKSEPALLAYQGRLLPDALRRERVVDAEVWAAVRAEGIADLAAVEAVVLETDGGFTVVSKLERPEMSTLQNVRGYERRIEDQADQAHHQEQSRQLGGEER